MLDGIAFEQKAHAGQGKDFALESGKRQTYMDENANQSLKCEREGQRIRDYRWGHGRQKRCHAEGQIVEYGGTRLSV